MPTLPSQIAGTPQLSLSAWANNHASGGVAVVATSHGSFMMFPLCPAEGVFPGVMTAQSFRVCAFGLATATASSVRHTLSVNVAIYTLANSTQLALMNSASTSLGSSVNNTQMSALYNGPRQIQFVSSQWSRTPAFSGTQYWVGLQFLSNSTVLPVFVSGFRWMGTQFSGHVGVGNTNSSGSRPFPGLGVFSASFSSALPSTVAFSQLRQADSLAGAIPSIVINNIGA
ncbi:MAG: hypothetical protein FD180_3274 [Planctomycetota bacterium]|nr:MAG: hypothetical protein FD180_3274 [Planctomycetota bacterium]